ncbi:hypothetical protein GYMLUDRAFT_700124 [Collybiopsis luxurians FD-317 M1]|uniref:Uncharacterized protein n=1 Tax=Collybiopsis luxurians FD-317 M1 TaxID=944289 RepID=A0A0D0C6S6_9AGAR|nr:hypothetical protein GYMLUDRAFT_700124 [Collybiopsis luxurians FD-317 M1]
MVPSKYSWPGLNAGKFTGGDRHKSCSPDRSYRRSPRRRQDERSRSHKRRSTSRSRSPRSRAHRDSYSPSRRSRRRSRSRRRRSLSPGKIMTQGVWIPLPNGLYQAMQIHVLYHGHPPSLGVSFLPPSAQEPKEPAGISATEHLAGFGVLDFPNQEPKETKSIRHPVLAEPLDAGVEDRTTILIRNLPTDLKPANVRTCAGQA